MGWMRPCGSTSTYEAVRFRLQLLRLTVKAEVDDQRVALVGRLVGDVQTTEVGVERRKTFVKQLPI